MTDNDILAEYIRENYPEIEQLVKYTVYKLDVRVREAFDLLMDPLKKCLQGLEGTDDEVDH